MAVCKDHACARRSSSGGVFYALATWVVQERNGLVVGARLMPDGVVGHVIVGELAAVSALQGSKYVQSEIVEVLPECKKALDDGKTVLFCGTPCQVAAAKAYLGSTKLLITVELICHGVPSPSMWRKRWSELIEEGVARDPTDLLFRTSNRRNRTEFCLASSDGKSLVSGWKDWYYALFLQNASLRECCYSCPHASVFREGDLVVGDCATSANDYDFHPDIPVSSVFPVSERGCKIFENVIDRACFTKPLDVYKEMELNKQLTHPTVRPMERDTVYKDLRNLKRSDFEKKYLPSIGFSACFKEMLKTLVSVKARAVIKRALGHLG